MATLNAPGMSSPVRAGITGDISMEKRSIKTTIAANDIVRMIQMPAFTRPDDLEVITDAASAGASIKAGWAAADGDVAFTDDDGLITTTSIATASRIRANAPIIPPVIPKDWFLIITVTGAGIANTTTMLAALRSVYPGTP